MKELEKLTKEQLIIELRFLQRAYEIIVEQNKKNTQALSQSDDINIKQIAEDFYGTCENDITIEQYVQVFQDVHTAFSERGLFNSQSEWIKVEDRLPKDKEWYQVSNGKGVYTIPHTYRENEGWLDFDGFPTRARITHYRLLDLTPPQTK